MAAVTDSRLAVAAAAAFATPVLLSPYFPGLDLPMHAVAASALHRHDDAAVARDFLGYVEVDGGVHGYALLYWLVDGLAFVAGGAVRGLQLAIALYAAAFAYGAYRLARAFELHAGAVALLAAPAAYSVVMAYGFAPYAIGYPLTFALWAHAREGRRWWAAGLAALALALTHPFAAALAYPVALALVPWRRERRVLATAAAIAAGLAPAVYFAATVGAQADAALPALVRESSLWDKWMAAERAGVGASIAQAPARLLGVLPGAQAGLAVAALAVAAAAVVALAGRRPRGDGAWWRTWTPELLLGLGAVVYLWTPYDMQAPYFVAIQPRLLPLLWMMALIVARPAPAPRRAVWAVPAAAAAVPLLFLIVHLARFGGEARDLAAVIDASAPRARTLTLIEQPPAPEDAPASPWRHAGAYLAAERGGFVAHMPLGRAGAGVGAMGAWLPVRRTEQPAPRAPLLFDPRSFDWDRHAPGWDQLLIRDADPAAPFDYVGDHAPELVARRGRWRLYRLGD